MMRTISAQRICGNMPVPRQYSIVSRRFLDGSYRRSLVFLGEIPNMPGHCMVSDLNNGLVEGPFHTGDFEEISEEEV